MRARTFVSFEADFPSDGHPAGRELAEFIASALRQAGMTILGPDNRKDWAWKVCSHFQKTVIETIVGFSDDGPRQWQIHTYARAPLLNRLFRRQTPGVDAFLGRYCDAIDRAIKSDGRFRTIRWYDQGMFDKDHGETWSEAP